MGKQTNNNNKTTPKQTKHQSITSERAELQTSKAGKGDVLNNPASRAVMLPATNAVEKCPIKVRPCKLPPPNTPLM